MFSQINSRNSEPKAPSIYEGLFYTFVATNYHDRLVEIANADAGETNFYPVLITYIQLFNECPELGQDLLSFPKIVLPECDNAARRAYDEVFAAVRGTNPSLKIGIKKTIRVRIYSLPDNLISTQIPSVKDVGSYTCLRGTIVRSTNPKLLEHSRLYKCPKCKKTFWLDSVMESFHGFPKAGKMCVNKCIGSKLAPVADGRDKNSSTSTSRFKDYQEVKLQEQDQKTALGSAKTVWVILEDDLVDTCKPGDDVYICGTIILRWKQQKVDQVTDTELALLANHICVNNDQRSSVQVTEETHQYFKDFWLRYENDPYAGRNFILRSFCPNIYGMYVVKLAMCVVIAGGVGKEKSGSKIRGESHLLLVGDPGTGKSQFLKYSNTVCPRSVMTTGIGTTNAGLTVSASKGGGEWQLEAGALVLADGGICCIDEFSCIKEHDRTSIHEAMEQQSISVAKAGMVCKLNTRCTIIASTNPKGKYDPKESLPLNVGLATPLLSRFDVLLVLRDAQNPAWDNFIADFILKDNGSVNTSTTSELWDTENLQAYFVIAKDFKPTMTHQARQVLSIYYEYQRQSANRNKARTTVRLLESLVRLSEGHARIMHRNEVILHDAITAITLVESSMLGSTLIGSSNTLHAAFPDDPMKEYMKQAEIVLNALNLSHFWQEEKRNLQPMLKARPLVNPFSKPQTDAPLKSKPSLSIMSRFSSQSSQTHTQRRLLEGAPRTGSSNMRGPLKRPLNSEDETPSFSQPNPVLRTQRSESLENASQQSGSTQIRSSQDAIHQRISSSPEMFSADTDEEAETNQISQSEQPTASQSQVQKSPSTSQVSKRLRMESQEQGDVSVEDEIADFLQEDSPPPDPEDNSDEDFV